MSTGPVILAINLVGAALLERAVGPLMARGGAGVFISSMAAHFIDPPAAVLDVLDRPLAEDLLPRLEAAIGGTLTSAQAYPYSKLGLNRLVRRQAGSWGKRGARINSISPGLIDTPMGALESVGESGGRRGALRSRLPLPRDGSMADIADAVEFLVSARAAYITGTDLLVDGGMSAAIGQLKGGV
jgi:NAD(P)-dependent dehydrogenase (short-subunit alcohol dehydrogenase family)